MRKNVAVTIEEKVDRREWDFSGLPQHEERACCFYEYGRESKYIITESQRPINALDEPDSQKRGLRNSPLVFALPPNGVIDIPWLAKDAKWRKAFCKQLADNWEGLSYARVIEKTPELAYVVGVLAHFPWQKWTERHTRLLDGETGLELLLVTIDWNNFKNSEIIDRFAKWINSKEGRPPGVGLAHTKGKRTDAWRKKLERLAILRLRHYYSIDEMAMILPESWQDKTKFVDERDIRRERNAARKTLLELFPFLNQSTQPLSWSTAKPGGIKPL